MSAGVETKDYRADIDGLRAVAVGTVVVFHAFPQFAPGGFVGVDIFFVISGFLISRILLQSLANGTFSILDFYARRVRRIFPALVLVLLVVWIAGWFLLMPEEYRSLGKHMAGGAAFISNFVLWNEAGYFDTAAQLKPLLHLWSLGVEEQFYLLWPFVLFIAWRRDKTLSVIIVFGLVSFAINAIQIVLSPVLAFYFPTGRMWELMIGALLAYAEFDGARWRQMLTQRFGASGRTLAENAAAVLGLAAVIASTAFFNSTFRYPGWWALVPTSGAFLIIAAGSGPLVNRHLLASRPFVFVGLISYPLYLWHWPLLSFVENVYSQHAPAWAKLTAVALAVALAWATYEFLEKPIRHRKWSEYRGVIAATLAASMTCFGVLGLVTYFASGFVSRLPADLQRLAAYNYDHKNEYRGGRCLIAEGKSASTFAPDCVELSSDRTGKPLVLLWGDSHAAALLAGIRSFQKNRSFSLGQFSVDACPPLVGVDIPNHSTCRSVNDFVLGKIREIKPDVVVLHATWTTYGLYGEASRRGKVVETIALLKSIGVPKIVLVGPVPIWNPSLPKVIFEAYRKTWPHQVPTRLNNPDADIVRQTDKVLRQIAADNAISYFSAFDAFCNTEGCLTLVDGVPPAWDSAHLTDVGARLVVGGIMDGLKLPSRQ